MNQNLPGSQRTRENDLTVERGDENLKKREKSQDGSQFWFVQLWGTDSGTGDEASH